MPLALESERIEKNPDTDEICNKCCCRCFRLCCIETTHYSFCTMLCNTSRREQLSGKECLQYTLCDDESSQCCRIFYYISLLCGCHCCLPACSVCHKVKGLERGVCDDCWEEALLHFKNAAERFKKMREDFINSSENLNERVKKIKEDFRENSSANRDNSPYKEEDCIHIQPKIHTVFNKYNIHDKATARKWLIQHHPDKNDAADFDVDEFQEVLQYYKNAI